MNDVLVIGGLALVAYIVINKMDKPTVPQTVSPSVPLPSVSPYWGYPSNIMNPSPSANNGSGWTSDNTTALIGALGGLGTQAIKSFA